MKKIIDGRQYDTEKATCIGGDSYGTPRDFNHWYEELYRKRTGEYFLYGEGGPMSHYRRATGQNSWSGSEDIKPLTVEEARLWAEKHLEAEDYEEEFGVIEDDDSRTVLSITMNRSLAENIRREASIAGMSISAYIERKLQG